ncbi:MAG: hypothetical protein QM535_15210 [Limnohabitans sp.]|nr:hypothetical protein [Limnohabitans sp.]
MKIVIKDATIERFGGAYIVNQLLESTGLKSIMNDRLGKRKQNARYSFFATLKTLLFNILSG